MKEKVSNKVREYSILRVILIILVVIGHSGYLTINTKMGGISYNLNTNNWLIQTINKLISWIYTFHMPAFFMLSGAVYHLSEKNNVDELAIKKFKRLLVPFFLYGIFFMLPVKRISNFYANADFSEVIKSFLNGGESGHLWFLPTLFWISILFLIITKIIKNKSIVGILIVTFLIQKYHKTYIPIDMFFLSTALDYIFWYALGYCFDIIRQKTVILNNKVLAWIFFGINLLIIIVNNKYKILNGYATVIGNFLMCYFLANVLSKTKIGNMKIIDVLEKYSMNIYLLHDPMEYIILMFAFKYNIFTSQSGIVLYVFARTIGVIILSILLTIVINLIKKFFKQKIFIEGKLKEAI